MRGGMIEGIRSPVNDFRIAQAWRVMRARTKSAKTAKTAYPHYGRAKLLLSRAWEVLREKLEISPAKASDSSLPENGCQCKIA
jgi:hypothetical protein